MDLEALFKITHGMYITGAKDTTGRLIGSCIDAVMVVEVDPAQIMISLGKQSYTCENVLKTKELTLSVLSCDASDDLIKNFGMQSSRTVDKWQNIPYHLEMGLPVLNSANSIMTLRVDSVQETTTHYVFLCRIVEVKKQNESDSLVYSEYQKRKKKGNTMTENKKWVCKVCGYVYDGEIPFEQLPEDWVCPLCGVPKSEFVQQ